MFHSIVFFIVQIIFGLCVIILLYYFSAKGERLTFNPNNWDIIPESLSYYLREDPRRQCMVMENQNCSVYFGNEIELKNRKHTTKVRNVITQGMTLRKRNKITKHLVRTFDNFTTFESILKYLIKSGIFLEEIILPEQETQRNVNDKKTVNYKKTDINSASEEELKLLPGISIIHAKKIIKRREEIGGFKTIKEFMEFIKVSPAIRYQLEYIICIKPIENTRKEKGYTEREIDL